MHIVYNIHFMIVQESLKSHIIKALWKLILDGKIAPNQPLREIHLAKTLDTSRTPLREALQQLEWEGILISEPRKGFRLADFQESDVYEIYPLRAHLESYALELSGIPNDKVLAQLKTINHKIQKAKSPKKTVALDEQWHLLLISNCPNQRLIQMIQILHRQSQRYEYAYMAMNKTVENSTEQHDQIVSLLEQKQLQKACKLFAENNLSGVDALINWLQTQNN